ncbi:hypothetical protein NDU88_003360 [Pleurodeles waltl]|uniref:Uncharacterized protein n=1 Tax=Pleurodeles waltl TaxID=8319 RepID=A0AAV7MQZ2_PLEWA|nr:hypothetical protein NDU88_003360 [Pleurodeles waltl]
MALRVMEWSLCRRGDLICLQFGPALGPTCPFDVKHRCWLGGGRIAVSNVHTEEPLTKLSATVYREQRQVRSERQRTPEKHEWDIVSKGRLFLAMAAQWHIDRESAAERMFKDDSELEVDSETAQAQGVCSSDVTVLFKQLEKLHKREIWKWWEMKSLKGYRTLTSSRSEWAENSLESSRRRMTILNKYADFDCDTLMEEIENLNTKLGESKETDLVNRLGS